MPFAIKRAHFYPILKPPDLPDFFAAARKSVAKQTLDGRLTVQVPVLMVEKALGDLNVQLNSGEASKRDGWLKPAR